MATCQAVSTRTSPCIDATYVAPTLSYARRERAVQLDEMSELPGTPSSLCRHNPHDEPKSCPPREE